MRFSKFPPQKHFTFGSSVLYYFFFCLCATQAHSYKHKKGSRGLVATPSALFSNHPHKYSRSKRELTSVKSKRHCQFFERASSRSEVRWSLITPRPAGARGRDESFISFTVLVRLPPRPRPRDRLNIAYYETRARRAWDVTKSRQRGKEISFFSRGCSCSERARGREREKKGAITLCCCCWEPAAGKQVRAACSSAEISFGKLLGSGRGG